MSESDRIISAFSDALSGVLGSGYTTSDRVGWLCFAWLLGCWAVALFAAPPTFLTLISSAVLAFGFGASVAKACSQ